jgi:hypothetical protein
MGMQISVEARTEQEWTALQSEGAPTMERTASSTARLFAAFQIVLDDECGVIEPSDVIDGADEARLMARIAEPTTVLTPVGPVQRNVLAEDVEDLIEMAQIARRIDRRITWG